jgi:hypothetical protein
MSDIANELAYPSDLDPNIAPSPGLTKLEYFAGQALAGMLADPEYNGSDEVAASEAVELAKALCAELAKTQKGAPTDA